MHVHASVGRLTSGDTFNVDLVGAAQHLDRKARAIKVGRRRHLAGIHVGQFHLRLHTSDDHFVPCRYRDFGGCKNIVLHGSASADGYCQKDCYDGLEKMFHSLMFISSPK